MTLYADYAGSRIVSARVTRPPWGAWSADVLLASDDAVPTRGTLTIGNLALVGAVLPGRDGAFTGSRRVRLVGGAGGWYRTIGARFYSKPQGVRLVTVVGDAATEVGETVSVSASLAPVVVGLFWARARGPAANVLAVALGRSWWVDDPGVTQIGERTSSTIASQFTLTGPGYRGDLGSLTVATEDLLSWRPGAVVRSELLDAPKTLASVTIDMPSTAILRVEALLS